jgi:hypothetical protein
VLSVQAPLDRRLGELTTVGLRLAPGLDYDQWSEAGAHVCRVRSSPAGAVHDRSATATSQPGRRVVGSTRAGSRCSARAFGSPPGPLFPL